MRVSAIAAMVEGTRAIGRDNDLSWKPAHLDRDMARFRRLTRGHPVIMGRKTWDSLDPKFKPLPHRANLVVTGNRNLDFIGAYSVESVEAAIRIARDMMGGDEVFIIGGAQVYDAARSFITRIYLTTVHGDYPGDTFFPEFPEFKEVEREVVSDSVPPLTFQTLERM